MQKKEIIAVTGDDVSNLSLTKARKFAKKKFAEGTLCFSNNEKEAINYVVGVIQKIFFLNDHRIVSKHPWKFIKTNDSLCGGYAYTRGPFIILSEKHLKRTTIDFDKCNNENDSLQFAIKLGSLLIHEQFHSLQRYYPEKFDSLYVDWGFVKGKVSSRNDLHLNQLTNPDAPKSEWLIDMNGTYYWPRTMIYDTVSFPIMGKDFQDVAFMVKRKNKNYTFVKDSLNRSKSLPLKELTSFVKKFPVDRGLDHPNEISAYMISEYYKALLCGKQPFENLPKESRLITEKFVKWIHKSL